MRKEVEFIFRESLLKYTVIRSTTLTGDFQVGRRYHGYFTQADPDSNLAFFALGTVVHKPNIWDPIDPIDLNEPLNPDDFKP
jgi:hypothetical protein